MQGIQAEPGISQFRRLCATRAARMMSTKSMTPDFSHFRLIKIGHPLAVADLRSDYASFGQFFGLIRTWCAENSTGTSDGALFAVASKPR
jgi:hypothetical protein